MQAERRRADGVRSRTLTMYEELHLAVGGMRSSSVDRCVREREVIEF